MGKGAVAEQEEITQRVQEFYSSLPFNFHGRKEWAAESIKENPIRVYQDLDRILREAGPQAQVLDVGCGAGWFVNSVAYHYGLSAIGIDVCQEPLDRAREVSVELDVTEKTRFQILDLFRIEDRKASFFLVNSIGVLHHTFDCYQALEKISCSVQGFGYLHLGLYHRYGREPFLNLFKPYRDRIRTCFSPQEQAEVEKVAYALYRELNPHITDETFLFSWFRDQVFHPQESQHTVQEIRSWLQGLGFESISTSINRFQRVDDWREIFEQEKRMSDLSYRRNVVEKRYFPGFFTLLARKR